MTRKTLLAAALAALASTSAIAADPPERRILQSAPVAPVLAEAPARALWTGFYAGVNAGAAINDSAFRLTPVAPSFQGFLSPADLAFLGRSARHDDVGFTGGGQAGYNFQVGSFVFGAEADLNYVGLGRSTSTITDVPASFGGGVVGLFQQFNGGQPLSYRTDVTQSVDWYGTARGRVGYAAGSFLFFGTGGLSYGEVNTSAVAHTTPSDFFGPFPYAYGTKTSDVRVGWTAGGGIEYALTPSVSLRGEYAYVDLGGRSSTAVAQGGAAAVLPDSAYVLRDETRFSVVRAGVNYRW